MTFISEVGSSFDLASAQPIDFRLFSLHPEFGLPGPMVIVRCRIDPETDQDYFRFAAQAQDTLTIVAERTLDLGPVNPAFLRFGAYLYDPGGFVTASVPPAGGDPQISYSISNGTDWTVGLQDNIQQVTYGYNLYIALNAAGRLVEGGAGSEAMAGWMGQDTLRGYSPGGIEADTGGDTLFGYGNNDLLQGGGGNDSLVGGTDTDRLLGGAGDDTLRGDNEPYTAPGLRAVFDDAAADRLSGGAGNDLLLGGGDGDVLSGGAGNDTISGDNAAGEAGFLLDFASDRLMGDGGDDLLLGAQSDQLFGGSGNDRLSIGVVSLARGPSLADGGEGTDVLEVVVGSSAAVTTAYLTATDGTLAVGGTLVLRFTGCESLAITGSSAADTLVFGAGNDTGRGGAGADTMRGEAGDDVLDGETGNGDLLFGGIGNDMLTTAGNAAYLAGEAGVDTLTAAGTNAYMNGGDGNDVLTDSGSFSIMMGGIGNDTIRSIGSLATIDAGSGNDRIELGVVTEGVLAAANEAVVNAGIGTDVIVVRGGSHLIIGDAGVDRLELDYARATGPVLTGFLGAGSGEAIVGAERVDWDEVEVLLLTGGAFADTLTGGAGADTIMGGGSADLMNGGGQNDEFRIDLVGAQGDIIADFNGRGVKIGDSIVFTGFGAGATLTALGGDLWQVAGSAGSATLTIIGGVDPTDYLFQ